MNARTWTTMLARRKKPKARAGTGEPPNVRTQTINRQWKSPPMTKRSLLPTKNPKQDRSGPRKVGPDQLLNVAETDGGVARPFKRVRVPLGTAPHFNGDATYDFGPVEYMPPSHLCPACGEEHSMGWCRLKVAGTEYCGLCGLAHLGHGRTCPHLNNEVQVGILLQTLKESIESHEWIEQATRYLRGVRGDLMKRKRAREVMEQQTLGPQRQQPPPPPAQQYPQQYPLQNPQLQQQQLFAQHYPPPAQYQQYVPQYQSQPQPQYGPQQPQGPPSRVPMYP